MPIVAASLRDEIILLFPPTWSWLPGKPNYLWLDALCTGFFNMWTVGTLTPGVCVLPGPSPHTHTPLLLTSTLMADPPKLLGLSITADLFVDLLTAQVATFLLANATLTPITPDACVPHDHLFLSFGVPATLAASIVTAGITAGAAGPGAALWADAFSTGLLAHLTTNAQISLISHSVGQHVLT